MTPEHNIVRYVFGESAWVSVSGMYAASWPFTFNSVQAVDLIKHWRPTREVFPFNYWQHSCIMQLVLSFHNCTYSIANEDFADRLRNININSTVCILSTMANAHNKQYCTSGLPSGHSILVLLKKNMLHIMLHMCVYIVFNVQSEGFKFKINSFVTWSIFWSSCSRL